MFFKPFSKQVWEHIDWLFPGRSDPASGQRLSLSLLEGWGVCVELFADGVPCTLFVDEQWVHKALMDHWMHPGLTSCTARELQIIMPLLLAPMGSLLGEKVAWLACHLHCIETPQWGIRFDWPEASDNGLTEGLQIHVLDLPLDYLKPLVESWAVASAPPPQVAGWELPFELELGRAHLLASATSSLKCGELIRCPQGLPFEEGAAWLTYDERKGKVACQARGASPKLRWLGAVQPQEQPTMDLFTPVHEPYVTILASVGQVRLPLEQLQKLAQGEIIEDGVQLYPAVHLLVNGRLLGKGELFWLGNEWAVRLVEKCAGAEGGAQAEPKETEDGAGG